jgi:peptidylprolyl isomerase
MHPPKPGNKVKVHYTGKLEDGSVFDSSRERDPLEFIIGKEQVIPGFEEAILDMEVGDTITTAIPAEKAYGPYNKEMIMIANKNQFPKNLEIKIGQSLKLNPPKGEAMMVTITNIKDNDITLDGNHPLAGKELTFDLELLEIT